MRKGRTTILDDTLIGPENIEQPAWNQSSQQKRKKERFERKEQPQAHLCPLVLLLDLGLLFWREVVCLGESKSFRCRPKRRIEERKKKQGGTHNVEQLSDLLWLLALDHVGNRLTSNVSVVGEGGGGPMRLLDGGDQMGKKEKTDRRGLMSK
jgi:hypothetical protein